MTGILRARPEVEVVQSVLFRDFNDDHPDFEQGEASPPGATTGLHADLAGTMLTARVD